MEPAEEQCFQILLTTGIAYSLSLAVITTIYTNKHKHTNTCKNDLTRVFNKKISNHYRDGQSVSCQIDTVELTFELAFAYKTYYIDPWQHIDLFSFYKYL